MVEVLINQKGRGINPATNTKKNIKNIYFMVLLVISDLKTF